MRYPDFSVPYSTTPPDFSIQYSVFSIQDSVLGFSFSDSVSPSSRRRLERRVIDGGQPFRFGPSFGMHWMSALV